MKTLNDYNQEVSKGERFEFGENWRSFLETVANTHIIKAQESLTNMLNKETLKGLSFLDAGCGSGLFSLAAVLLGARVLSFDFDPSSVACTRDLKRRFAQNADHWKIESGNILDRDYLSQLGKFDIVYSWGVLHHTGNMSQALENIILPLQKNGTLFLALYNDQGRSSQIWKTIKITYNILPGWLRFLVVGPAFLRLWGAVTIKDILARRPFYTWAHYSDNRGMSAWHDLIDWVGGYPFEVAKPEVILDFYHSRGFELLRMKTCGGGLGCNEFVFQGK